MNVQLVESIRSLIESLPQEERNVLRSHLLKSADSVSEASVDLNQFSGVIRLLQDPMEYQCQMRDEWM